jgi:tripartite-type tricarboxylate transporter receptor subunit TctC
VETHVAHLTENLNAMKNLVYGASTLLVGDDVANAVLHYAAILAEARASDVVDIPTCDETGFGVHASVVLGPGMPVMAIVAPDDALEQEDPAFVAELTARIGLVLSGSKRSH